MIVWHTREQMPQPWASKRVALLQFLQSMPGAAFLPPPQLGCHAPPSWPWSVKTRSLSKGQPGCL